MKKKILATIGKKPKKQNQNQNTDKSPNPPARAYGIKKCIMYVYAQGQRFEVNMQSQVQNFLAIECFTLQFEHTLIVLCVILTYYTGCMYIYFI